MDDDMASIDAIYDAVGDAASWRRVCERLAGAPSPSSEVAQHLELARRLHERQNASIERAAVLATAYAQLGLGVLVVDADGQLLRANAMATRLLHQRAGLAVVGDRVVAVDPNAEARFRTARAGVLPLERRLPWVSIERTGRRPLSIIVVHAFQAELEVFEPHRPVVLILIDPDAMSAPTTRALEALFGFTAREAECAALLMQGRTIEEAARAMGVARVTARTFLASMTAKTDSHSQAELVVRLLAIPYLG